MQCFDLAVVGGGLVGASFVRSMVGSGLKILVVDHLPAHSLYSEALDNRGLALAHSTQKILEKIDCWNFLKPYAYPIETVHVSEQGSFGFTKLNANTLKMPALGYVVSASNLGKALINDLEKLDDVTVMRPAQITQIKFDTSKQSWNITVNQQIIQTKLLIAADGVNSFLRTSQNILAHTNDYKQSAIVTNIGIDKNITCAYERFTVYGIIALLPFGENNLKCVWSASNEVIAKLNDQNDLEFLQTLQSMFGFRIGKFLKVSERKTFKLSEVYAEKIYAPGMLLIGNAANSLHPVAAQGFNLGIRDATELAKNLIYAKHNNIAINDITILEQYAKARESDHNKTRKFTNTLVNVFASENFLFKFSRRVGILTAQFIPMLNKKIIARGQGIWI